MHNLDVQLWSEGATREVFFALGLAGVGRDEAAVPGPVLIAVLSDLGLRHGAYRDRLRRCARLLGYAWLRGGLLIASADAFVELQSLLSEPPREAQLLPARIELAPADARRLAHRLWALDAFGGNYRARVVAVRDAINDAVGDPPAGPQALRAFAAATPTHL